LHARLYIDSHSAVKMSVTDVVVIL